MTTRPENSDETAKAAEWVARLDREAADGTLWEETLPVAEQLADHFARLGLTDTR